METDPAGRGRHCPGDPKRGICTSGKPGNDYPGRGTREQLPVGESSPVSRQGCGKIPLLPAGGCAGAGLRHAFGGDYLSGPEGRISEADPPLPLQPAAAAQGGDCRYAGGGPGRQRRYDQYASSPGAGGESPARGAEHFVSQPPWQQPDAVVRRVRGGAAVSPMQRAAHLPQRQRAADVPLLRPLGAHTGTVPGVRRTDEADWCWHAEGGRGARAAVSPAPGPADGCGHGVRES